MKTRTVQLLAETRNAGAIGIFEWREIAVELPNAEGLEGDALGERAADHYREITRDTLDHRVVVLDTPENRRRASTDMTYEAAQRFASRAWNPRGRAERISARRASGEEVEISEEQDE